MRSRFKNHKINMAIGVSLTLLTALSVSQAASAATWTIQSTPLLSGSHELNGVSCPTSTFCVAVGGDGLGEKERLIERWNGSEWTAELTTGVHLRDVSCVSSTFCMAVGYSNGSPYAVRWNGTEWKESPVGATGKLTGVSCTSSSECAAVGYTAESTPQAVLLHWHGTTWESQPVNEKSSMKLQSVSCLSASYCMAVGYSDSSPHKTAAALWNGGAGPTGNYWLAKQPQNASETLSNQLEGISCVPTSLSQKCIAVGSLTSSGSTEGMLAEELQGEGWSILSNPAGATKSEELLGVSCASVTACIASGYGAGTGAGNMPLFEGWNGLEWSFQTGAKPEHAEEIVMRKVSCSAATACTAVGYFRETVAEKALIERYQ